VSLGPPRTRGGVPQETGPALGDYASRLHEYWGDDAIAWHGHAGISGKAVGTLGDYVASLTGLIGHQTSVHGV
jgi:hypothetical protein